MRWNSTLSYTENPEHNFDIDSISTMPNDSDRLQKQLLEKQKHDVKPPPHVLFPPNQEATQGRSLAAWDSTNLGRFTFPSFLGIFVPWTNSGLSAAGTHQAPVVPVSIAILSLKRRKAPHQQQNNHIDIEEVRD